MTDLKTASLPRAVAGTGRTLFAPSREEERDQQVVDQGVGEFRKPAAVSELGRDGTFVL